jgi:hypothetical protein
MIRTVLALAILLAAAPARADTWQVGAATSLRHHGSPSLDPLAADDSHAALSLSVGRRLPWLDGPRLHLLADAQLEVGGIDGTTFQSIATHTGLVTGLAGVLAHRELGRRFSLLGRAALGLTRVDVELATGGGRLEDRAWTPTAYLGTGADFQFFDHLALRAEVGYLATAPIDVEPDLGRLDVSAWSLRLGLAGRF